MPQVWLKTNSRVWKMAMVIPAAILLAGIVLLTFPSMRAGLSAWIGGSSVMLGLAGLAWCYWLARQPRVAYREGRLLLYLRFGAPVAVPIELVEGFLLGQGPTLLPGERNASQTTSTAVIRIAERAEEWEHIDVEPLLGSWCDHYVTIRGTWCEPLNVAVVQRLNERLAEAHAAARGKREVAP